MLKLSFRDSPWLQEVYIMASRLELHEVLCGILGSRNVYFQPPENQKIQYPAIVYSRNVIENTFANNKVYNQYKSYEIVVIDKDPDSVIVDKISMMDMCVHERNFKSDNLNHDIFTLYY